MEGEIELFVSRLKMAGILDTATARKVRRIAGPDADVITFGEKVIAHVCEDFALVQRLLDESSKAFDDGTRVSHDPFTEDELDQPPTTHALHDEVVGREPQLTRSPFREAGLDSLHEPPEAQVGSGAADELGLEPIPGGVESVVAPPSLSVVTSLNDGTALVSDEEAEKAAWAAGRPKTTSPWARSALEASSPPIPSQVVEVAKPAAGVAAPDLAAGEKSPEAMDAGGGQRRSSLSLRNRTVGRVGGESVAAGASGLGGFVGLDSPDESAAVEEDDAAVDSTGGSPEAGPDRFAFQPYQGASVPDRRGVVEGSEEPEASDEVGESDEAEDSVPAGGRQVRPGGSLDYGDLDLAALAALAAESLARAPSGGGDRGVARAAAESGSPIAAGVGGAKVGTGSTLSLGDQLAAGVGGGKLEISIRISAPEDHADADLARDRAHKPPEAIISAQGITAVKPRFGGLSAATETQLQAFLLTTLAFAQEQGFSDLHLVAGARPYVRKHGELLFLDEQPLESGVTKRLTTCLLSKAQREYFERFKDYDFCLALDNGQRYRANLLVQKDGFKGTFRIVPDRIRNLAALGFGDHLPILEKLLSYHNGLILIGGPSGSGKTTTLAAMVDYLNQQREDHIITVEDPIEIIHQSKKCTVTQRGVGAHTESYRRALKGALRQDPDIIVIGEMRNLETIEMAVSASETGHLVLATLHTNDAANTLNRILDVFPPAQQPQIRAMVSESLRGIVCQQLLPATDGRQALACEILVNTRAVASLIRDGRQQGLANIMETGRNEGMVVMDASIYALWREKKITSETAQKVLHNEVLRRQIRTGK